MDYAFQDGQGPVPAHRHPNGGGWVSDNSIVAAHVRVPEKAEICQGSHVDYESDILPGAVVINSNVMGKSKVEGVVQDSNLDDSQVGYGDLVIGSTLTSSAVQGSARVEKSTLKDTTVTKGVIYRSALFSCHVGGRVEGSTLNWVTMADGFVENSEIDSGTLEGEVSIRESSLERINGNGKIQVLKTKQSGSLNYKGDTFLTSVTINGIFTFEDHTTVTFSTVKGVWVIRHSLLTDTNLSGVGNVDTSKLTGGTIQGNFSLYDVEVRDQATLIMEDGGKSQVTNCFLYGKAQVSLMNSNLFGCEFFGEAEAHISGFHKDLYLYAGVSNL